jgi:hypothetical protein
MQLMTPGAILVSLDYPSYYNRSGLNGTNSAGIKGQEPIL